MCLFVPNIFVYMFLGLPMVAFPSNVNKHDTSYMWQFWFKPVLALNIA
jgi:hypothetical protein